MAIKINNKLAIGRYPSATRKRSARMCPRHGRLRQLLLLLLSAKSAAITVVERTDPPGFHAHPNPLARIRG
jgi:hypothetical protein